MEQKIQTHIAYGFVTALAMILVYVILEVTKLNFKPGISWISNVVFLIGIILNAIAYSKANGADVTFGKVFGSCFKATAIVAIVMVAWSFIVLMVFPGMEERALEMARNKMEDDPNMSEEQRDMAMNYTQKYFKVLLHAGALFGNLVLGAIFSLIGAAIAKKAPRRNPELP